ncbi:hypothetical protein ES703_56301 [subsurface metagenome]
MVSKPICYVEYRCNQCGETVRKASLRLIPKDVTECPNCGSKDIAKTIIRPA